MPCTIPRALLLVASVFGVSVPLLSACSTPSETSGTTEDPGRPAFSSIALPTAGTVGAEPEALAQELYGTDEPVEDDFYEEAETLTATAAERVVLFTRMGLPDDSVRGTRYRLEFVPQGDEWALTWAGRQVMCWPGRGHDDWGTAPCL